MKIQSDTPLTFAKGKHSWTIRPEMGIVTHFPGYVCRGLIAQGAQEVRSKKSSKDEAE